jgi:hypothetical protein
MTVHRGAAERPIAPSGWTEIKAASADGLWSHGVALVVVIIGRVVKVVAGQSSRPGVLLIAAACIAGLGVFAYRNRSWWSRPGTPWLLLISRLLVAAVVPPTAMLLVIMSAPHSLGPTFPYAACAAATTACAMGLLFFSWAREVQRLQRPE